MVAENVSENESVSNHRKVVNRGGFWLDFAEPEPASVRADSEAGSAIVWFDP